MLFLKKTYWQFLLKSTNEHGVHSPFVYDLITLCFYKKDKNISDLDNARIGFPSFFKSKQLCVLNDLFGYLKVSKIVFLCSKQHAIRTFRGVEKTDSKSQDSVQAVYVDSKNFQKKAIINVFEELQNNSFLILEDPYSKKEDWCAIKKETQDRVIVNVYYFALVFKRKQQVGECFYIRL